VREIGFLSQTPEAFNRVFVEPSLSTARNMGFKILAHPDSAGFTSEDWAKRMGHCEALISSWGSPVIDESLLEHFPNLKIIGHAAGSLRPCITEAVFARGIVVCGANALMARSVAEACLAMLLMACRGVLHSAKFGRRSAAMDWKRQRLGIRSIEDLRIGIWGFGDVAKRLVEILVPLNPKSISICDPHFETQREAFSGVESKSWDELCRASDVFICLASMTEQNYRRFGEAELAMLPEGSTLINAARAGLVDTSALLAHLERKRIFAILDVFDEEPLSEDHPLNQMENVILTPHNAGNGREPEYLGALAEDFDRFFRGLPLRYEISKVRLSALTQPALSKK